MNKIAPKILYISYMCKIRLKDKLCNLLYVYINVSVHPIAMELWEIVENTSAKVSSILHPRALQYELSYSS